MSKVAAAMRASLLAVSKDFVAAKRRADKEGRLRGRDLARLQAKPERAMNLVEAVERVMEDSYNHVSDNGSLPAEARQLMYAARERILRGDLTDGKLWAGSSYFTQKLLPDFIEAHPELCEGWDVVFDARGHFREPHTGARIGLGTLEVRGYIAGWRDRLDGELSTAGLLAGLTGGVATAGPHGRYSAALFIEKEGFDPLLERSGIAERYDLAIMSTKGMSVTAARKLVDNLSRRGVTVYVVRDFDKSGFSIVHTLQTDSRRYRFAAAPKVVDLGLRLEDVRRLGLQSEEVTYAHKADPRINLIESGATREEADFLVRRRGSGSWSGERVELNAMTSRQMIAWLEGKLDEHGVKKLIPGQDDLAAAFARAGEAARRRRDVAAFLEERKTTHIALPVPTNLADLVRERIAGTADAWDSAVRELVEAALGGEAAS